MIRQLINGRWLGMLFAVVVAVWMGGMAGTARADGLIVIHNPPRPVPGHFTFAPLEVVYHKVEATIDDQVAVTGVDQEFYNPNGVELEGDYIFPVPNNAQIDKFTMDIDGKPVQAELLPAEKARKIYEDIVRKSKDPALLEYAGRAMFRVRIFPIEANGKKHITLKYTQLLKLDNNLLDYHYTLNTEKFSSKPLKNVALKVTVNQNQPITTIYSPTHEVEIKRSGETKAVVGFEAKDVRPDRDFHLYIGRKATPVGIAVLSYKPESDKDGYFVMLAAPTVSKDAKVMPKDVVFVMDTSGSMSGAKIEQAKKALKFCVNSLSAEDRFEIVRFSTEAEPFFKDLRKADGKTRKKAEEFIDGMRASGGTAIQEALAAALKERSNEAGRLFLVVFLTDGQPTIGEQNPDRILAGVQQDKNAANVRIFSFGIGTDVNTKLLDQLGEQSRGVSQYVLPDENIEVAVSNFFGKVTEPVLAAVKADTGAVAASKVYPKEMPDLFKGDQLVVFGTYAKGGNTAVTITGMVGGKEVKFAQDVTFEEKSDSSKEWIGKLWAVRRVGYLLDEIRLHGESKELKEEVTELARKFGIVTPYTAMLIVEDERARGVAMDRRVLRELESDHLAMSNSKAGDSSFRSGGGGAGNTFHGANAVAGAINLDSYKQNGSLEGAEKAAQQSASRQRFDGQNDSALARNSGSWSMTAAEVGGKATLAPTPTGQPAAPGAWGSMANGVASQTGPGGQQQAKDALGYRVVTNYAQQNTFVNNRAFYLNGNQWTDTKSQKMDAAKTKTIKIVFGSDAYFDLLKTHPDAAQWMALGNNVTFELEGAVYEITEETTAK